MSPNQPQNEPAPPAPPTPRFERVRTFLQLVAFVIMLFFVNVLNPLMKGLAGGEDRPLLIGILTYGSIILLVMIVLVFIDKYLDRLVEYLVARHLARLAARRLEQAIMGCLPYDRDAAMNRAQIARAIGRSHDDEELSAAIYRLNHSEWILQPNDNPKHYFNASG
jgi:hypothetical protein